MVGVGRRRLRGADAGRSSPSCSPWPCCPPASLAVTVTVNVPGRAERVRDGLDRCRWRRRRRSQAKSTGGDHASDAVAWNVMAWPTTARATGRDGQRRLRATRRRRRRRRWLRLPAAVEVEPAGDRVALGVDVDRRRCRTGDPPSVCRAAPDAPQLLPGRARARRMARPGVSMSPSSIQNGKRDPVGGDAARGSDRRPRCSASRCGSLSHPRRGDAPARRSPSPGTRSNPARRQESIPSAPAAASSESGSTGPCERNRARRRPVTVPKASPSGRN